MMTTRSSLSSVTLIPFVMLINSLHEFGCRFLSLFALVLGSGHNSPPFVDKTECAYGYSLIIGYLQVPMTIVYLGVL
jgi:hypothetical protein